jgi:hypothetical protein
MKKRLLNTLLLITALSLVGCSRTHVIDVQVPVPLVDPIPAHAALLLTDEFSNYSYQQSDSGRDRLTVVLGDSQVALFRTIFSALFDELTDQPRPTTDLVIHPELNAFQFALPKETGSGFYEVWVRYRLRVEEPDGTEIADWLVSGYGRASTERLQGQGAGMQEAAGAALRDLGTQLAIGFPTQANIVAWKQQRGLTR